VLELTRGRILTHRLRVGSLDERMPYDGDSLRVAAWAGLQDSVPRAASLSIHARVDDARPDSWEDPALLQLWGPRWSVYVVAEQDRAVFSLGRLPRGGSRLRRIEDVAARLRDELGDRRADGREVGRALGLHPNAVRYAAPTGTVAIRWDGAHQPEVWMLPQPEVEAEDARRELARRYLQVFGPATAESFGRWAGVNDRDARHTFGSLQEELTTVRTPIGDRQILTRDADRFLEPTGPVAPARLLPSGDPYYLAWGEDRELLVEDPRQRAELWTSRVWPGAVMVDGEVVGTWRRAEHRVTVRLWRWLDRRGRDAVEAEAAGFPLPSSDREVEVAWQDPA
jgi:hypothetical protein